LSLCLILFGCEKNHLEDNLQLQKETAASNLDFHESQSNRPSSNSPVSIASYNLRLLSPDDSGIFAKDWDFRKNRVQNIVENYDFDIIGVQEPSRSQVDDFIPLMPQYGFVGKSNNGNYLPGNQWTTFNAIFYKTTKFDII